MSGVREIYEKGEDRREVRGKRKRMKIIRNRIRKRRRRKKKSRK